MMRKITNKLGSIKLAVALIFIIAVIGLIGILLPQIPAAFSSSPDGYAWWVENVAYSKLGTMVYTLEPLGFFNIFHSAWFAVVSTLLLLNILVCTLSRTASLKTRAVQAEPNTDPEFYENGRHIYAFESPSPIKQVSETAIRVLENHNYTVIKKDNAECIYIAGDRHRLSSWGTLPVHLSLILLIIGALVSIFFGFRDDSFIVSEGTTKDLGHETGLAVHLNSFTDTYWDNGTPKDYSSNVQLYENGQLVKSGIIRVNHPLTYKGVRLHQGFFGQAVSLQISDLGGKLIFSNSVPLTRTRENDSLQRSEGEIVLPDNNYHVIILGHAANGTDPYIGENQIGIEFYDADMTFLGWLVLDQNKPQQMGDLVFTFQDQQFTGLMISKDPGTGFLWTAAALFLAGLGMIFYFPHRRIWLSLYADSETGTKVAVKLDALRELGPVNEPVPILHELGFTQTPEGSTESGY